MEPTEVSFVLRRIATNIDKAKNPSKKLVVRDLQTLLASMRVATDCHSLGHFIFPAGSKYVKDGEDHFPAGSKECARNAWAQANKYDRAPSWFNGSLTELLSKVRSKAESMGIDISEESASPGKG